METEIFCFSDGAQYSRPITTDFTEEDLKEMGWEKGSWEAPFSNKDIGGIEVFYQSDIGPMLIYEHGDIIKYERI